MDAIVRYMDGHAVNIGNAILVLANDDLTEQAQCLCEYSA